MLPSSETSRLPKIVMISHYSFVSTLLESLTTKLMNDLRTLMIEFYNLSAFRNRLCNNFLYFNIHSFYEIKKRKFLKNELI